jgi:S1-C subfamily serine protease
MNKKLLGMFLVLGLLLSGNAYAISFNLSCKGKATTIGLKTTQDIFLEDIEVVAHDRKIGAIQILFTNHGLARSTYYDPISKDNKLILNDSNGFTIRTEKVNNQGINIKEFNGKFSLSSGFYSGFWEGKSDDGFSFMVTWDAQCSGSEKLYAYLNNKSESSAQAASSGSGFFINNKGYFVTNNHVVKGCKQSKITFKEEEVDAELIATDETLDLALLRAKVKPKDYLNISDEPPEKMQKVFVAGYPFGKGLSDDLKFTTGIISAVKGFADNSNQIQLDAAINSGNSGGPIVNEDGDLVAVAVSGLDKSKAEGIGFGIKASSVINFLEVNNVKYSSSSLINFGMSNKKLNKLMEASTVYTFCN